MNMIGTVSLLIVSFAVPLLIYRLLIILVELTLGKKAAADIKEYLKDFIDNGKINDNDQ